VCRDPLLDLGAIRLIDLIAIDIAGDPLAREEPAEVGMLELTREAALRAASARTIRRLAEQAVPEPEGEPLLADPRGPCNRMLAGSVP